MGNKNSNAESPASTEVVSFLTDVPESLIEDVLGNPSIRENILRHTMFSEDNTLNRVEVKTLRLVCKTWHFETHLIIYKEIATNPCVPENRAFHQLTFYEFEDGSFKNGFEELPKALSLNLLNNPNRVDSKRFPPIKLELSCYKLISSQTTLEFLRGYATWIVNLTLRDYEEEVFEPDLVTFPDYPDLPLNNLKTLYYENAWYGLPQLQKLLRGATTLRSFDVGAMKPSLWGDTILGVPNGSLADLVLPSSLQELRVRSNFSFVENAIRTAANDVVSLMERNKLPKLKTLELSIGTGSPVTRQHLTKILTPVSESLENLVLSGFRERTEAYLPMGLPEKGLRSLKRLTVGKQMGRYLVCAFWDLQEEYANPQLGDYFPNLQYISLYLMSSQVDLWLGCGAVFNKVKHAKIRVHEYQEVEPDQHDYKYFLSLSPDQIIGIHKTFPNLLRLTVQLVIPEVEGLRYVFSQMKNLEELQIIIAVTYNGRRRELGGLEGPFNLDAFLLGISSEEVEPAWEDHKRGKSRQGPTFPGVCLLEELKSLTLHCSFCFNPINEVSVLSDAAFDLGFLKMTKLNNLKIYDKFAEFSEEKLTEWKRMKGTEVVMMRQVWA